MKYLNTLYLKKFRLLTFFLSTSAVLITGCEEYLEVDPPISEIPYDSVFEDEFLAHSAVENLYTKLRDDILFSGMYNGNGITMGLYADELDYYAWPGNPLENFYNHTVLPNNTLVKLIWDGSYNLIYMSNSILEGTDQSTVLTEETQKQLKGEALFIRSVGHFYLMNLFGEVPYVTGTDYLENQSLPRTDIETMYQNIIDDLLMAKSLLPENYYGMDRIRANRYTVSAFLARVYLYHEDWQEAVNESSSLINAETYYTLEQDIDLVFDKNSTSTILQFKPGVEGLNSWEGMILNFITQPYTVALNPDIYNSMDDADARKANWIAPITIGDNTWYACTKYKQNGFTGTTIEFSKVFRLAEQYLIRSEAYTQLGNLTSAKNDLNLIRTRAGLSPSNANTQTDLLNEILEERRFEFFAEQGHRWFDLKRLDKANEILSPIKPNWQMTNYILPLPEIELLNNPNLLPQNPGY